MEVWDCNSCFGLPSKPSPSPAVCETAADLTAQLDRAGIVRSVTWHIAQHDVAPTVGNRMLAEAIRGNDKLLGCWTVLPPQTDEMPVDRLLADMKAHRIVALRAFPVAHRYLLNAVTMGPLLDEMVARRIPLLYSTRRLPAGHSPHQAWQDLYNLMAEFPELTLIVLDHGSWGCDRYFRPLFDQYERVYVDTSMYYIDGGIEDVVARYGPGRIVYGSGLPERYPGGMMMAIRHAQIDEAAKAAIAGGTLRQLIQEVKL
jgi:predicted TIM-barrel fold metal-dependent hydrolase